MYPRFVQLFINASAQIPPVGLVIRPNDVTKRIFADCRRLVEVIPDTPLFGHVIDEDYVAPPNDGWLEPGAEEVVIPQPVNQPPPPPTPPAVDQPPPPPQENQPPPPLFQLPPPPNPPSPPPSPPPLSPPQPFNQQAPESSSHINLNDHPDLGNFDNEDFDMETKFSGYKERMMQVPSGLSPRQPTLKRRREEDIYPEYEPPLYVQRTTVAQDVSTSGSQPSVDKGKSVLEDPKPIPPTTSSPQTPITQTPITEFLSTSQSYISPSLIQTPNPINLTPLSNFLEKFKHYFTPILQTTQLSTSTQPEITQPETSRPASSQLPPISPLLDIYTIIQQQMIAAEERITLRFDMMEMLTSEQNRLIYEQTRLLTSQADTIKMHTDEIKDLKERLKVAEDKYTKANIDYESVLDELAFVREQLEAQGDKSPAPTTATATEVEAETIDVATEEKEVEEQPVVPGVEVEGDSALDEDEIDDDEDEEKDDIVDDDMDLDEDNDDEKGGKGGKVDESGKDSDSNDDDWSRWAMVVYQPKGESSQQSDTPSTAKNVRKETDVDAEDVREPPTFPEDVPTSEANLDRSLVIIEDDRFIRGESATGKELVLYQARQNEEEEKVEVEVKEEV